MSCTRNALYIKHSHHLRDMIVTYYNHQEHTHKYQTNSPVVYTSVLQEGFRQDFVTVSSPPQLHLQNTQHETAIFLHEHLTVAHVCTGANLWEIVGQQLYIPCWRKHTISIISFKTKVTRVKAEICQTVHFDMGRVDLPAWRALLGFELWQSANKGLPLGSVKYHMGSISGVEDLDFS